jgi:hypothetical protein
MKKTAIVVIVLLTIAYKTDTVKPVNGTEPTAVSDSISKKQ